MTHMISWMNASYDDSFIHIKSYVSFIPGVHSRDPMCRSSMKCPHHMNTHRTCMNDTFDLVNGCRVWWFTHTCEIICVIHRWITHFISWMDDSYEFDRKKPPPRGGVSIYYVPWSRAVCKRFHDEMRPSHLVWMTHDLVTTLFLCSWPLSPQLCLCVRHNTTVRRVAFVDGDHAMGWLRLVGSLKL